MISIPMSDRAARIRIALCYKAEICCAALAGCHDSIVNAPASWRRWIAWLTDAPEDRWLRRYDFDL